MSLFMCIICNRRKPLEELSNDICDSCLVCSTCAEGSVKTQVSAQLQPPEWPPVLACNPAHVAHQYAKNDKVMYITRERTYVSATVVHVDRSMQPPQYGIVVASEGNEGTEQATRYTEFDRLRPQNDAINANAGIPKAPRVFSPCCGRPGGLPQLQALSTEAFLQWSAACTDLWLSLNGIIRCPRADCGALIQSTHVNWFCHGCLVQRDQQQQQGAGLATGSRRHHAHKQAHRFRCALCRKDFCDMCRAWPYHEGLTCQENALPDCMYCRQKVREGLQQATGVDVGAASTSALRQLLSQLGLDASWCIEKQELQAMARHYGEQLCSRGPCREKLHGACTRRLPCGHWCCGVRGESSCPPCIWCAVSGQEAAGDMMETETAACQLCLEPLSQGPAVQLSCQAQHMCHLECGKSRLKAGYPGPEVTFSHLFCPVCRAEAGTRGNLQIATGNVHMDHPSLQGPTLGRILRLREEVVALAKAQLRDEGLLASEPELQPGGRYDGRPADYALTRYTFYECSRCGAPYYGGAKACRAAGQAFDKAELVCGGCSVEVGTAGMNCPRHGRTFIEYKCRFCCSPASWYCWGTTHMCSSCHEQSSKWVAPFAACNLATCQLAVKPHPPPGQEFCLGCGLCRRSTGRNAAAGRS